MADKKITLNELSLKVGLSNVNLSRIKNGKIHSIRLSTLNSLCNVLNCQPEDILEFRRDKKSNRKE